MFYRCNPATLAQGVLWVCGYCGGELGVRGEGGTALMEAILGPSEAGGVYGPVIWGCNLRQKPEGVENAAEEALCADLSPLRPHHLGGTRAF